jgi:hypothetical protein
MRVKSRLFLGIITAVAMMSVLAGCGSLRKVRDIKVTSVSLESYSLNGLRSADGVLAVGIDNPSFAFTVTRLDGVLKYKGEEVALYSADKFSVDKQCVKVYDVPCKAFLGEGISLMQVMQIIRQGNLEGLTTDIEAKVKLKNGAGTKLKFKDLDLQKMAEKQ